MGIIVKVVEGGRDFLQGRAHTL